MANNKPPHEWIIAPLKKYATFKGRAGKPEYWWFFLFYTIVSGLLAFAEEIAGLPDPSVLFLASNLFLLALFLPWVAVYVRRLHDIGLSGYWLLLWPLSYFLLVGIIIMFVFFSDEVTNWPLVYASLALLILVNLAFTVLPAWKSDPEENRYGPPPPHLDVSQSRQ